MAGLFFLGGPLTTKHHHHHHHNKNNHDEEEDSDQIFFTKEPSSNHNHLWRSSEESYFALRVGPAPFDELTGSGLAAMMRGRGGGSGGGAGGGGGINCQDCGNQAKKDCPHLRCRTCCKSRGLPCSTHVKSTWVPAAKRRERQQQQLAAMQQQQQEQQQHFRSAQNNNNNNNVPKRQRDHDHHQHHILADLPPLTYPTPSTGLEVGDFPSELNSPALFRCVRVSSMEEEDEEYAYQTALNIGGHVFKGILYDQGPDTTTTVQVAGESSSSRGGSAAPPPPQPLNLITTTAAVQPSSSNMQGGANNNNLVDPSSLVYPAPLSAFMGQFFPPPRS